MGRRLPALVKPGPDDVVRWQCPCCDLALLETAGATYDQAYAVRLKHWQDCHPKEPRVGFIVMVPATVSRANAAKATQAVRAAAVSRRILALKGGSSQHVGMILRCRLSSSRALSRSLMRGMPCRPA